MVRNSNKFLANGLPKRCGQGGLSTGINIASDRYLVSEELEESLSPPCCHHWIIQSAVGPTSEGRCQKCGESESLSTTSITKLSGLAERRWVVPVPKAMMTPLHRRASSLLTLEGDKACRQFSVTVGASLTSVNRLGYYLKLPQDGLESTLSAAKASDIRENHGVET